MRSWLGQLSRMRSQLSAFEEESRRLRTQLESCHELMNRWVLQVAEAKTTGGAQPILQTVSSTSPPSVSSSASAAFASAVSASSCGAFPCSASSSTDGASSRAGDASQSPPSTSTRPLSPLAGRENVETAEDRDQEGPLVSTAAAASSPQHGSHVWGQQGYSAERRRQRGRR